MTPTRRAASMTSVPFGTVISMPSIVSRTVCEDSIDGSCRYPLAAYGLRTEQIRGFRLMDQRDVFGPPIFQRAHDRRDFGVSEGAHRATGDVLTQVRQGFKVLRPASLGTMRRMVCTSQALPSRQGLHLPQDS